MMNHSTRRAAVIAAALLISAAFLCPLTARADVTVPNVFGSNMVMQRDIALPVWGQADAGEKVTVKLAACTKTATADKDGAWKVTLPAMKCSAKPITMTISGKNKIELENILIGEVWVCSGQSNMQWSIQRSANAKKEIAESDYPLIRIISVKRAVNAEPQKNFNGAWQVCSPKTSSGFSAVGYFFGRKLHKDLKMPIGLINTSWGGTRIEPWTPTVGFDAVLALKKIADDTRKLTGKVGSRTPRAIYNSMIAPLKPVAIRGAIWYQGESNMGEGMLYFEKMKALIGGWRKVWDQGDFPFGFVQLAPFDRYGGDKQPKIWEAQTAALSIPNTGMCVTTDITTLKNIHPPNKQDVGLRLALWALATSYDKKDLVYSGPMYKSMKVSGKTIVLTFDHVGGGLASRDDRDLDWFEIAGDDKAFVKASAKIVGTTVVVSCDTVAKPAAVRFGWSQKATPNLMNKEGLPASPFRTDKW
ncbi:MAG: sialate O-acetylesterase [Phycisphaerae bacterium]|jgi:sialate O-acetylesterase|nr:sialate O-acetylesterase [Phycisphaerae bacterium]